jgi:hypothetical protein
MNKFLNGINIVLKKRLIRAGQLQRVRDASLLGRNGRRLGFGQLFSERKTSE